MGTAVATSILDLVSSQTCRVLPQNHHLRTLMPGSSLQSLDFMGPAERLSPPSR